jgi:hypothetical protein
LLEGERVVESAITRQAGPALTLDYASPEQLLGQPISMLIAIRKRVPSGRRGAAS